MTQEANKEEGLRCLAIARQALEAGDVGKAERFAAKAMKLYPHDEVGRPQARQSQKLLHQCGNTLAAAAPLRPSARP